MGQGNSTEKKENVPSTNVVQATTGSNTPSLNAPSGETTSTATIGGRRKRRATRKRKANRKH